MKEKKQVFGMIEPIILDMILCILLTATPVLWEMETEQASCFLCVKNTCGGKTLR